MRSTLLTCLMLAAGCSDGGPAAPSDPLADMVGSWNVETFEFRSAGDDAIRLDFLDGATITLVVHNGGTFSLSSSQPGGPAATVTGTMSIRADTVHIAVPDEGEEEYTYTRAADTMTWRSVFTIPYDDSDPDSPELFAYLVFRRR